jgi:hypothetical protein
MRAATDACAAYAAMCNDVTREFAANDANENNNGNNNNNNNNNNNGDGNERRWAPGRKHNSACNGLLRRLTGIVAARAAYEEAARLAPQAAASLAQSNGGGGAFAAFGEQSALLRVHPASRWRAATAAFDAALQPLEAAACAELRRRLSEINNRPRVALSEMR